MITLKILDYKNNCIETWTWKLSRPIPNKGDTLLLHVGNNVDDIYRVTVLRREFDITNPDCIGIVTNYTQLNKEDL